MKMLQCCVSLKSVEINLHDLFGSQTLGSWLGAADLPLQASVPPPRQRKSQISYLFLLPRALASPPLRLNQIPGGLDEAREKISTAFQGQMIHFLKLYPFVRRG